MATLAQCEVPQASQAPQASSISTSIDMDRLVKSMSSGKPIEIPHGLSREEKRKFILQNR